MYIPSLHIFYQNQSTYPNEGLNSKLREYSVNIAINKRIGRTQRNTMETQRTYLCGLGFIVILEIVGIPYFTLIHIPTNIKKETPIKHKYA